MFVFCPLLWRFVQNYHLLRFAMILALSFCDTILYGCGNSTICSNNFVETSYAINCCKSSWCACCQLQSLMCFSRISLSQWHLRHALKYQEWQYCVQLLLCLQKSVRLTGVHGIWGLIYPIDAPDCLSHPLKIDHDTKREGSQRASVWEIEQW